MIEYIFPTTYFLRTLVIDRELFSTGYIIDIDIKSCICNYILLDRNAGQLCINNNVLILFLVH